MPKGTKIHKAATPDGAWCDFCSRRFKPTAWNERTCLACAVAGAPNQARLPWTAYQKALATYLRETGRRQKLSGAAASPTPPPRRWQFPRATQTP